MVESRPLIAEYDFFSRAVLLTAPRGVSSPFLLFARSACAQALSVWDAVLEPSSERRERSAFSVLRRPRQTWACPKATLEALRLCVAEPARRVAVSPLCRRFWDVPIGAVPRERNAICVATELFQIYNLGEVSSLRVIIGGVTRKRHPTAW